MERITVKEVNSMMEAVAQVYEQPEVEQPEVEQLDEVANDPRSGVIGQLERQRRKMFGTPSEVNQSASYEASINALTKRRGPGNVPLGADGKPITAAQIAAETKRRRLADPKYKPGQGVDSGAKPGSGGTPTETKPTETKSTETTPTETKPTETKPTETRPAPVKTFKVGDKQMSKAQINARYAELRKTDPKAAKEFGNQAFAATNPKIATANAERSRIRGTAQTDNPLIDKQMRSRMPLNSPSVQSSEVSKLGKGNQSLSNNPNALRAAKPVAKPAPVAKPTPVVRSNNINLPSGTKRVNTNINLKANTPNPTNTNTYTGSVAQRLQAIRGMRSVTSNQGVNTKINVKPKPPSTTGQSTTPTVKQESKMERMTGKGALSLIETYSQVYEEREPQAIDEGILGALKKVGKAVLGPADQSPEAEAARTGARRPQGETQRTNAVKLKRVLDAEKNEDVDLFDIIKGHLIEEHELSEDVAIKLMSILDEETRGDIMEYTAAIRADAAPKGTTMKMTAGGQEPAGDKLLKGIKDKLGGFLQRLNPKAMKSTTVEPRKPLVSTQKNSYELEGELVDEGSYGSKKKKKSKKGGH